MCFAGFAPDPRSGADRAFGVGLIHQILLKSSPPRTSSNAGGDGHNDAVDFFFRSRGLHSLFTRIEIGANLSIDRTTSPPKMKEKLWWLLV
ncbi:hypothetical protein LWI28_000901 [Acer negundo]|uniref:Uncharacterized protein n=1 Tax=Acer negundo TaxID=4023 RepID=A0AAD5J373_ACENE|nr:hypothetical protein LWI28_000901 [Acer negundo]KAK4852509.1 hypothetical protein QYF36_024735 [Acer negundo]